MCIACDEKELVDNVEEEEAKNTILFLPFSIFAKVRLDHTTRTLSFGSDLNYCTREDAPLGPQLQSMPSEQIRNQLTAMSSALAKALAVIKPPHLMVSHLKSYKNLDKAYILMNVFSQMYVLLSFFQLSGSQFFVLLKKSFLKALS